MKRILTMTLAAMALVSCVKEEAVNVTVENKSSLGRNGEMVEVDFNLITNKLKMQDGQKLIVLDKNGQQVPYQIVSYGEAQAKLLIFQTTLSANQSEVYKVKTGTPDQFEDRVKTTFMPQRKDDISWENDRVAYRMYGPALEIDPTEAMVSGGSDIWVKKTPNLVTQQWYKDDLAGVKSYHEDHGEGLDFYSVGVSLGAGTAAPILNDSMYYITHNFKSYEILDNGPLRTVFKLTYEPYNVGDITVNETRMVSLDAGSNMNKITEFYGDTKTPLQIAAGFPWRGNDTYSMNAAEGYISYAEPNVEGKGVIYLGVVSDVPFIETKILSNQLIGVMDYQPSYMAGKGLTYYSGGGWNQGGFPTLADWNTYVADFAMKVRNPLIVSVR